LANILSEEYEIVITYLIFI